MMEQLPNELILMILNKLDSLNDLLRCRLVCRRWNELVKLIRIRTLKAGERYQIHGVEMDEFSIDLNPVRLETQRIGFMKSTLMKTTILSTILSRLKQVCFCYVHITTEPAWTSFEKSLQQLR